jgi:Kef-type K+ transport system membrane component KefB
MPSFGGLLILVVVAFGAPFLLGLAPRLRLPSVVFEIVVGIVIGPSVLGWVKVDDTISVLALMGLAILLFLAGLEIDFGRLRGRLLQLALVGWALSFGIAFAVALLLKGVGLIETPLLVAIILCATSLGVLIPVLKDAGEIATTFGQLIVAAASIADFGAIILLSIFFSGQGGIGSTLLLGALFALAAASCLWGQDSRGWERGAGLFDVDYFVEEELRSRRVWLDRRAALLAQLRPARPVRPRPHAFGLAAVWLGRRLVRWGVALQRRYALAPAGNG